MLYADLFMEGARDEFVKIAARYGGVETEAGLSLLQRIASRMGLASRGTKAAHRRIKADWLEAIRGGYTGSLGRYIDDTAGYRGKAQDKIDKVLMEGAERGYDAVGKNVNAGALEKQIVGSGSSVGGHWDRHKKKYIAGALLGGGVLAYNAYDNAKRQEAYGQPVMAVDPTTGQVVGQY